MSTKNDSSRRRRLRVLKRAGMAFVAACLFNPQILIALASRPPTSEVSGPTDSETATGTVRGRVLDADGQPRSGVTVELADEDRRTSSDRDGGFEIDRLAAGEHLLQVVDETGRRLLERQVRVTAGAVTELLLQLPQPRVAVEEIVVVSQISMLSEEATSGVSLDREAIAALPTIGDDFYRAARALPGTGGSDFAAGFSVRGGYHDQVLVRLDGLEVYEPFHLKDFQGVFSILDGQVIAGMELLPGAFPAEYGDRSAAVVNMTTRRPDRLRHQLGISFSNAWLGSAGQFADQRGGWLASARRGYLDIVLGLVEDDTDEDEQPSPRYWDAYGKLEYDAGLRQRLTFSVLAAEDSLDFTERDPGEIDEVVTSYGNGYGWLYHQGILGASSFVDSSLSAGRVDQERFASLLELDERFLLDDRREVTILGLRQDWNFELSPQQYLKAGFEIRSFDAEYVYADSLERDHPLDDPRFQGAIDVTEADLGFEGEQYGLWLSDRVGLGPRLTAELGVRYDRQELSDDDQLSPRVNLLYDLGRAGALRAGWGRFFQSQKPHELGVEFGEERFQPAQRAEHLSLGWERGLGRSGRLRLELYRRQESDSFRRWETLFDPFHPVPQAAVDLVEIAPERATAEGIELYLGGRGRGVLDWWVSYAYGSVTEVVAGRDQRRSIDQPHAFAASLTYRPNRKWTLTGLYRFHTGWPTTSIDAEVVFAADGPRAATRIGPFYAERLADYHSFDLRISRRSQLGRGALSFFIDVQNLLDRDNERGLDLDESRVLRVDDRLEIEFETTYWLPVLPSFGISWEF